MSVTRAARKKVHRANSGPSTEQKGCKEAPRKRQAININVCLGYHAGREGKRKQGKGEISQNLTLFETFQQSFVGRYWGAAPFMRKVCPIIHRIERLSELYCIKNKGRPLQMPRHKLAGALRMELLADRFRRGQSGRRRMRRHFHPRATSPAFRPCGSTASASDCPFPRSERWR